VLEQAIVAKLAIVKVGIISFVAAVVVHSLILS
jgi:hypothetical protein